MRERGFTLLELLMVIVILSIITSIVIIAFKKVGDSQSLDKSALLVASVLDEARTLTLSSFEGSQYGVHFDTNSVTRFKGATYSVSDANNVVTSINSKVSITTINLTGGGSNVVFKRLTGFTDQPGTITLNLLSSPSTTKTVTVSASGIVE